MPDCGVALLLCICCRDSRADRIILGVIVRLLVSSCKGKGVEGGGVRIDTEDLSDIPLRQCSGDTLLISDWPSGSSRDDKLTKLLRLYIGETGPPIVYCSSKLCLSLKSSFLDAILCAKRCLS